MILTRMVSHTHGQTDCAVIVTDAVTAAYVPSDLIHS